MNFTTDVKLKGKIAEGGGGVVYKAELLNPDTIARFATTASVVKVLKRMSVTSIVTQCSITAYGIL